MKISREEFKEFVGLYREAWDAFDAYADIIDQNLLDRLIFPAFTFTSKAIGMEDKIFRALVSPVPDYWFEDENGEETTDLDVIYDRYINCQEDK